AASASAASARISSATIPGALNARVASRHAKPNPNSPMGAPNSAAGVIDPLSPAQPQMVMRAIVWRSNQGDVVGTLPTEPKSFAGVSREEMLGRARALVPKLKERAAECESLRRLPDATERDLHDLGLFRIVQPKRVGGAELDFGIMLDVSIELGRGCAS